MMHEEYKEAMTFAALDALDAEELRALEEHLATCESCRREMDELRNVTASLAYTVTPVAPPAELRSRILESARALPREENGDQTASQASDKRATTETISPVSGSTDSSKVIPFKQPRAELIAIDKRTSLFSAIAASIVIAALVGTLAILWKRNNEMRAEMNNLSARLNQTQQELEREREALAQEQRTKEVLTSPDSRSIPLAGTEVAPAATARLFIDRRTGRAVLSATGLPPAPAGKAYQIWYIATGKQPAPGAVFNLNAQGHALLDDVVPIEGRDASIFAVTLEPERGSSSPTGDKYLLGKLS